MSEKDYSKAKIQEDIEIISTAIALPEALEEEIKTLTSDGVSNGILPPTIEATAAATLLTKRNTQYITQLQVTPITTATGVQSDKDILNNIDRLSKSSIDSPSIERSSTELVRALTIAANELTVNVDEFPSITTWCDKHGLGKNESVEKIVAKQTALTVFLRAIVFETTETVDVDNLTQETYSDAIEKAHEELGNRSPQHFALDALVENFPKPVFEWLLELRDHIKTTDNKSEFLADCYEQLIDQEERWRLGQFRTPTKLATLVAELGVSNGSEQILAPGIGAGGLVSEAIRVKDAKDNLQSLSDIHGVDVSPLSLLLGSASLINTPIEGTPNFECADFFSLSPDDLPNIDTVLSNPPYTKHHELTAEKKNAINNQISKETGYSFSKLSPLYVYFTVHATQFLDVNDKAVFLTPAEILNTKYGVDWKDYIDDHYNIQAFILFDQDNGSQFTDAATTSLITIAERQESIDTDSSTVFLRIDEATVPGRVVSTIKNPPERQKETEWGFVNTVNQNELNPTENWSTQFDDVDTVIDDQLVPLSKIAKVKRGIATGQNSFFCLSEKDRVKSGKDQSWDIPEEFLSPVIRKSHRAPHYDYTQEDWDHQRDQNNEVWLLYHLTDLQWDSTYFSEEISDDTTSQQQLSAFSQQNVDVLENAESKLSEDEQQVVAYLKYGMQLNDPPQETHLAQNRNPWYVVEQQEPADFLYTSMTRDRGRFIDNKVGARNLNNVHSIHLTVDLSTVEKKALLAYLNSEYADTIIKRSGRTLSSGMSKVEPGDLQNIPVIDPRSLEQQHVESLAELFDSLCKAARYDDIDEQEIRIKLQEALQSFLEI